ncbi:MAG: GTP-binding protein [Candidatus Thorarchaeota archaeon]|nr:MAG: GTP-binding protein [Candidatus Thorarchaeota archaeon]
MIHNAFLIRLDDNEILSSVQYWPVEVGASEIEEYISTREELAENHDALEDIPLVIDQNKFMGSEVNDDSILVFVTDKGEDELSTQDRVKKAAHDLTIEIERADLNSVLERFEEIIEPSVVTRLKIALVGEGGTGKTTTLHLLLGDTPPLQYVPTIALNLETVENIRFGNYSLVLWDFAGQERFRTLWRFYFHGADVIILVCDSTLRNVIISKDILKLIKRDAPKVPVFAIANKQDKPNAMKPEVVQKILGIPTYPMVAIDKGRRDEMLRILMTAAAQYVGVALPDLPASELLKFSEEAVEAAAVIASAVSEEEVEEEYETVEIVEEILVDEDGRIIEDADEYEIVEEVIEYVDVEPDSEEAEGIFEEPVEVVAEEPSVIPDVPEVGGAEDEIEHFDEDLVTEEIVEHMAAVTEESPVVSDVSEMDAIEEFFIEVDAALSADLEEREIEIPVQDAVEDDVVVEGIAPEMVPVEASDDFDVVTISDDEVEEAVPILIEESEIETSADESNGSMMARALISEALDADDLVSEEIEKATKEELETALEAFSCEEVVLLDGEVEPLEDLDDKMRTDLERALGILDTVPTDDGVSEENNRLDSQSSKNDES